MEIEIRRHRSGHGVLTVGFLPALFLNVIVAIMVQSPLRSQPGTALGSATANNKMFLLNLDFIVCTWVFFFVFFFKLCHLHNG